MVCETKWCACRFHPTALMLPSWRAATRLPNGAKNGFLEGPTDQTNHFRLTVNILVHYMLNEMKLSLQFFSFQVCWKIYTVNLQSATLLNYLHKYYTNNTLLIVLLLSALSRPHLLVALLQHSNILVDFFRRLLACMLKLLQKPLAVVVLWCSAHVRCQMLRIDVINEFFRFNYFHSLQNFRLDEKLDRSNQNLEKPWWLCRIWRVSLQSFFFSVFFFGPTTSTEPTRRG